MKLPTYMTTVTGLSKSLALILFVALPFIGFYFGVRYQKSVTPVIDSTNSTNSMKKGKTLDEVLIPGEFQKDLDKGNFVAFKEKFSVPYVVYENDGVSKELILHGNCIFTNETSSIQKSDIKEGDVITVRKIQPVSGTEQAVIVVDYSR